MKKMRIKSSMNWRNCFGFPEQSAIRFGKVNDREENRMSEEKLKRSFGTKDVFTLAFGTMIGWGWIMLSGQWAASAGMMGAIIAYVVGAVFVCLCGTGVFGTDPGNPLYGGKCGVFI